MLARGVQCGVIAMGCFDGWVISLSLTTLPCCLMFQTMIKHFMRILRTSTPHLNPQQVTLPEAVKRIRALMGPFPPLPRLEFQVRKRRPGSAGHHRRDGGRPLRRAITGAKLLRNGLESVTFTNFRLRSKRTPSQRRSTGSARSWVPPPPPVGREGRRGPWGTPTMAHHV